MEEQKKKGLLDILGFGAAKKAGKDLTDRKGKVDKAIEEQTGDKDEYVKGKDAGELGKKYEDHFRF
jgi:hypothetical protein